MFGGIIKGYNTLNYEQAINAQLYSEHLDPVHAILAKKYIAKGQSNTTHIKLPGGGGGEEVHGVELVQ